MTKIEYLCGDAFISGIKLMHLREIEEEISYTIRDIQGESDEIYRVLRGMIEFAYLCGDAFNSGVK